MIKNTTKKFAKGYWCASPYWKTCQLDCTDCNMLRKKVDYMCDISGKHAIIGKRKDYGRKEKERKI